MAILEQAEATNSNSQAISGVVLCCSNLCPGSVTLLDLGEDQVKVVSEYLTGRPGREPHREGPTLSESNG